MLENRPVGASESAGLLEMACGVVNSVMSLAGAFSFFASGLASLSSFPLDSVVSSDSFGFTVSFGFTASNSKSSGNFNGLGDILDQASCSLCKYSFVSGDLLASITRTRLLFPPSGGSSPSFISSLLTSLISTSVAQRRIWLSCVFAPTRNPSVVSFF